MAVELEGFDMFTLTELDESYHRPTLLSFCNLETTVEFVNVQVLGLLPGFIWLELTNESEEQDLVLDDMRLVVHF